MSSFQDYMDNLIAILRLKEEKFDVQIDIKKEDLNKMLDEKYKKYLMEISTNTSLRIPKKINFLLDKPEQEIHRASLQSYFDIGNAFTP